MMDRRRALMMAQGGGEQPVQYPFDGAVWTERSAYRLSDGAIITDNAKSRTDKVTIQTDGCYRLSAPTQYTAALFWDDNGRYMGQYECAGSSSNLYIYAKSGWKYAFQVYNASSPSRYDRKFELFDAGASAIARTSLTLSELSWNVSSNVLETNIASVIGSNPETKIKTVNHHLCLCPSYVNFSRISTANDPLVFFIYQWSNQIILSARYFGTNLTAAMTYFRENGTTLEFNY